MPRRPPGPPRGGAGPRHSPKWGRYPSRPAAGEPRTHPTSTTTWTSCSDVGKVPGRDSSPATLNFLRGNLKTAGYTGFPWVRVTEIHYRPLRGRRGRVPRADERRGQDGEHLGWYLEPIGFEIPKTTYLGARETVVFAKSPETLLAAHPTSGRRSSDLTPGPPRWGRRGARARCAASAGPTYPAFHPVTIDLVRYGTRDPWPEAADGAGRSLEVIDIALDDDYPSSWKASDRIGGSPGSLSAPPRASAGATPTATAR